MHLTLCKPRRLKAGKGDGVLRGYTGWKDLYGYRCFHRGIYRLYAAERAPQKVYSVDVGHGQLAWKLRQDERVVCMEKTNFRYVTAGGYCGRARILPSVDVSFISLTKILIPAQKPFKGCDGRDGLPDQASV